MVDPANIHALDDLRMLTGQEVRAVVASAEDLSGLVARLSRLDAAVAEAIEEEELENPALVTEIRESADDAPVIKLVNSVIAQAVEDGASDIHFEPDGRHMRGERLVVEVDSLAGDARHLGRRLAEREALNAPVTS